MQTLIIALKNAITGFAGWKYEDYQINELPLSEIEKIGTYLFGKIQSGQAVPVIKQRYWAWGLDRYRHNVHELLFHYVLAPGVTLSITHRRDDRDQFFLEAFTLEHKLSKTRVWRRFFCVTDEYRKLAETSWRNLDKELTRAYQNFLSDQEDLERRHQERVALERERVRLQKDALRKIEQAIVSQALDELIVS